LIKRQILNYGDYLGNSDYIAEVVSDDGADEEIINLLTTDNVASINDTCLFIRDYFLSCATNQICEASWNHKFKSLIIPQLEKLVFADNHFIRKQVIYTLAKICSYESVPILLQAFEQFRDEDPILLPQLVGELFWLGVDNCGDLMATMITSNQYTTRWAVIATLPTFMYHHADDTDENLVMRINFCEHLRHDANKFVQAEAEYEYQCLMLRRSQQQENLSKSEYKQRRQQIKTLKPALSFSQVEVEFSNYLYNHNLGKYTIPELEKFINTYYE
jgi:hypothetical protein